MSIELGFMEIISVSSVLNSLDRYQRDNLRVSGASEESRRDAAAKQKVPGSWDLPFVAACALECSQTHLQLENV